MKKKKKLSLSLNKKNVSELNRSFQNQVLGGTHATYGCGGGTMNCTTPPTGGSFNCLPSRDYACPSGFQCSLGC